MTDPKEKFKTAKEDFKKNPTQKTSDNVSKTGTDLIQSNKKPTKTDSTAIYKENFKIAKEDFKKNPTEKNSAKVSKAGTELIQYNKRKGYDTSGGLPIKNKNK